MYGPRTSPRHARKESELLGTDREERNRSAIPVPITAMQESRIHSRVAPCLASRTAGMA